MLYCTYYMMLWRARWRMSAANQQKLGLRETRAALTVLSEAGREWQGLVFAPWQPVRPHVSLSSQALEASKTKGFVCLGAKLHRCSSCNGVLLFRVLACSVGFAFHLRRL